MTVVKSWLNLTGQSGQVLLIVCLAIVFLFPIGCHGKRGVVRDTLSVYHQLSRQSVMWS
jgi:hypothetical protein